MVAILQMQLLKVFIYMIWEIYIDKNLIEVYDNQLIISEF